MTGENGEPVPEGAPGWAFWETADWVRFHEISMEPGISILSGMTEREKEVCCQLRTTCMLRTSQ